MVERNRDAAASGVLSRPHVWLAWAGVILTVTTSIVGSAFSLLAIPFAVWSALPYGGLWLVGRSVTNPWPVLGAGLAALAVDLGVRGSVFLFPRGSTAAVALVFSPVYIAVIVMPLGAMAAVVLSRLWRWHAAGRLAVLTITPVVLCLLVLGLARPDLFPTTVLERRALLDRMGPPRVVVGAETFRSVQVSSKAAWYIAGEFDGAAGEELAIVEHAGVDLVDPATLNVKARVAFTGTPGQLWGSFSTLVRLPSGDLVVAQTGGGYSRTRLQGLDGAQLWEYRPDPRLATDAMRPADLDRDGVVEFYAASAELMVRLGTDGQPVWRQPTRMGSLVATLPATDDLPAWVVGVEYDRRLLVWDAAGRLLVERAVSDGRFPLTAVDFFAGRCLIEGGRSVRALNLDGALVFELPLGDFTVSQVIGGRLGPAEPPSLVVVGSTDRDTGRYRLVIVNADRGVVYDEILDQYPQVIAAKRGDGSDALFIRAGAGLRLLTNH